MGIDDWKKYFQNDWNNIQYIEKPDTKYVSYSSSGKCYNGVSNTSYQPSPIKDWIYVDLENNSLHVDQCKYDATCENDMVIYTCPVCGWESLEYHQECSHCGSYMSKNIEID